MSVDFKDIFGVDVPGASPEDFAAVSKNVYVRSQVQIALASPDAKGRRLSAMEALSAYGMVTLCRVASDGYAPLVLSRNEPADTLRRRRIDLGLEIKDVAKASGLDPEIIKNIESAGKSSKIRDIERLSVCLALDERKVGFSRDAGDPDLGVRLRELKSDSDTIRFDPSTVLKLAEAGWIIGRHNELAALLKINVHPIVSKGTLQSHDYRYRTAERGYELAIRARQVLGLSSDEPISSVRDLIERVLGIPLVQDKLSTRFAGATIANGEQRGIVVNEEGQNQKPTVRRMTLAHEIGHLVGDPDDQLNRLRVDTYDTVGFAPKVTDPVERRANGFAVAFLAPPTAVKQIAEKFGNAKQSVDAIVNTYGISKTAASNHLENITGLKISDYDLRFISEKTDWTPAENLTLDYFSITDTPLRKRGRFASLVVKAERAGLITTDTAAGWLNTSVENYSARSQGILELQD